MDNEPQRRVIVLGASNVARGISTIVATSQNMWGVPLDLMAVLGHGRSYGLTNRVLGRTLPSIVDCRLWAELNERPALPTASLITDIGNDIVFGVPASLIVNWVECCLKRLRDCERITMTELPTESLAAVGPVRFYAIRSVLFPQSKVSFEDVRRAVDEVNASVRQLAADYGASLVKPKGEWYGIDPIHIRLGHWRSAWRDILGPWSGSAAELSRGSLWRWAYLRSRCPYWRKICGVEQQRDQPCGRLGDGTRISFY